jgi:hypothetical protein
MKFVQQWAPKKRRWFFRKSYDHLPEGRFQLGICIAAARQRGGVCS